MGRRRKAGPQQWLRTSAGTHVQITAIQHRTASVRVHNLTVADIHTYHVVAGDKPLLVHNSHCYEIGRKIDYFDPSSDLLNAVHNERLNASNMTLARGSNLGAALLSDGRIITARSGAKGNHSEVKLIAEAQRLNLRIKAIYSERAPCNSGYDCAGKIKALGYAVDVTWSFPWNHPDATKRKKIRDDSLADMKASINELLLFR